MITADREPDRTKARRLMEGLTTSSALACHVPDAVDLLDELDVEVDPRSADEILAAEPRLFDLIWYQRSVRSNARAGSAWPPAGGGNYPAEELGPYPDFERDMLNGELSALR
jgi:hypothetical protein